MLLNKKYDDCPQYLKDFLFYMSTIRGRSIKTVDAYHIDLRTFLRYIKTVKTGLDAPDLLNGVTIDDVDIDMVRDITLSDVYGFLDYADRKRANKPKTRARKISCIRSLFKYLTTKAGILEVNPVKDLETPSRSRRELPKYLTLEESIDLMTHVDTKYLDRDYCIITLFLNCGMRLSELVGMNLSDIRGNTVKLLGKGNKERIVYLNETCLNALERYLRVRENPVRANEKNTLFLSSRGTRLTPRRVQQIVGDCLRSAGLSGKGYSPHKLRHTAATLMYQHGGVDIRVLKEVLGHANLATTEIYTHVSDKQIENAANASPLSKIIVYR